MTEPFVHLRVHTEYSLVDGLNRIKPLLRSAGEQSMPALAITDQNNGFGWVKFYSNALSNGIKPIIGADLWLENPDQSDQPYRQPFLCMNNEGYRNLIRIISRAWQENQINDRPVVRMEWLSHMGEGLIALSGANYGDVGQALLRGNEEQAESRLKWWLAHFPGRYYLELHRTGRPGDDEQVAGAVSLAQTFNVPVVATNDVMFLEATDFEAHEARVCINESVVLDDPRRSHRFSEHQYLKTSEEMAELFHDLPSALRNSVTIARRCNVDIELGHYYLPEYPIPDDLEQDPFFRDNSPDSEFTLDTVREAVASAMAENWAGREADPDYAKNLRLGMYFHKVSYEGLDERLAADFDTTADDFAALRTRYQDRLRFELDIILQMGFPGYFLIVMDFIQWAKDQGIPVGPGRGSGAGSLVAYAQKITDLDPIKYDLLFERFLNPERVSMPDFDVDFCMEKRDQVINYVAGRYGREAVSQIVTFGTLAAKAVVRDVARVQGKSYGLGDRISKMIPGTPGMTLTKALEEVPELADFIEQDDEAQEIWEMAMKLEGITRQTGKHAGGVVIAPTRLTDFSPLLCEPDGSGLLTQFDKNDVESAGLVKFDFLGLRTLTIIDWALDMINARRAGHGEAPIDITQIPQDDARSFEMLNRAQTTAVFQLESRGMKGLIRKLQPDNLEEMIALVALFRPGPLDSGMVDNFINRKHKREAVSFPDVNYQHDSLRPILESTYGIIVYQEQVMQIAQTLAGYTLGGADLLRRAMGKKKPEEMEKQRRIFADGAAEKGIDPELAAHIFDLVEKFAGYGFNKSHSAAYALVSYQTLWLKAHYPAQFMAATMSSELDNTDKIVIFLEECRELGVTVLPPDVNAGEYMFTVNDDDEIVFGLGAVKGVGEGPVAAIVEARRDGKGAFRDLFDFCARVNLRRLGRRVLEALIKSGALDQLGPGRSALILALPAAMQAAEQQRENQAAGIIDLFGDIQAGDSEDHFAPYRDAVEWPLRERLQGEKETLGLYLTGHPIDEYESDLHRMVSSRLSDITEQQEEQTLAGLVLDVRRMKSKQGKDMAFVTLDDRTARVEVGLFGDIDPAWEPLLRVDEIVVIRAEVSWNEYRKAQRITVRDMQSIEAARAGYARALVVDTEALQNGAAQRLSGALRPLLIQPGDESRPGVPVLVRVANAEGHGEMQLGDAYRICPDDHCLHQLRQTLGADAVSLRY